MIARSQLQPAGVSERLRAVRARVAEAAARAGRAPEEVLVVAVAKTFPAARVEEALAAGQADIAESRAQELRDKARQVRGEARWHFVGHLQRNKVKHVVGVAGLIHSVDRHDLAEAIAERATRTGRTQAVLVQANVGEDPAKSGFPLEGLRAAVGEVEGLEGLTCRGLMTIPPMGADPRPLFGRLREARDALREDFPAVEHLSMGMSNDFEAAIEEGATIVRLGEAVFGPRPQPA